MRLPFFAGGTAGLMLVGKGFLGLQYVFYSLSDAHRFWIVPVYTEALGMNSKGLSAF